MASPKLSLTFTDGKTEVVTLNPRVLVEVERHYKDVPGIEGSLYGAWFRLGRPGGDFEKWLDTVEDMEEGGDAPVPSKPGASADS